LLPFTVCGINKVIIIIIIIIIMIIIIIKPLTLDVANCYYIWQSLIR